MDFGAALPLGPAPRRSMGDSNELTTAKIVTKGRQDLAEKCTRLDFVWRSKPLLMHLAPKIGLLDHREMQGKSETSESMKSPSPLATQLNQVATDLKEHSQDGMGGGDKAQRLQAIAKAFEFAAEMEEALYQARVLDNPKAKVSAAHAVALDLHAALAEVGHTRELLIIPSGWVAYGASSTPENLVLLVVTRISSSTPLTWASSRADGTRASSTDGAGDDESPYAVTVCNAGQGAYQYTSHPTTGFLSSR